ncbi:subtilisin-like protease [Cadophora sp. DSE1049]|nr:subtilisin-like protease [Cadophora sp. DSE1049]
MLFSNQVVLFFQAASLASAVTLPSGYKASPRSQKVVPGAFIVTFESSLPSSANFYQNLTANGIPVTTRQTFDPAIFAGTSFHLHDVNDTHLDTIGNFTQVKSISPVRLHQRAAPVGDVANVAKLWSAAKLKGRAVADSDDMTTHKMTGVDKLQAEGLDGSGITIGIIDTGIDYNLPALGGGIGPGFKIAYGYDLVGDYDANGNPAPDDDPMDCLGHGTHVAGIIGASNDPYILGVAPNATLHMYKVFACEDNAPTDILIQAFIMAHNNGVDVITSSIGSNNGWPEDPWSAATAAIVAAGTPCMLAAGNAGEDGMFYASSAASGTDVTAVGSVDNTNTPTAATIASYTIDGGAPVEFVYNLAVGNFSGISLPIVATSLDSTVVDDACAPITTDLTGTIALIRRGTCTFDTKVANAVAAGAQYVFLYNNVAIPVSPAITITDVLGVAMLTNVLGEEIVKQLAAGHKIQATFGKDPILKIDTPGPVNDLSGNTMSTFSSYGLSAENTIKPVVSGPGGSILSTYLTSEGSYAVLSGTSMATPFVAGVVALYMQAKGRGINPKVINSALAATANPLNFNDGTKNSTFLASVAQQGSGLVDAYQMVRGGIAISEANLALNDTANFVKSPSFYVENTGTTSMTYILSHQPAANSYAFDNSYGTADNYGVVSFPPQMDEKYSSVVISPSTLTIAPGAKKRVSISVTPDASLNSKLVPVYSGFIKVTSSSGEVAGIPYAGVATKMNDIPIADPSLNIYDNGYAFGVVPYSGPGKTSSGSIDLYKPSVGSVPFYYWSNTWASKVIRIDIVSVNGTNPVFAAGLATVGSMAGFPWTWEARSLAGYYYANAFDGYLADETLVKSGVYKMVLRLAKAFADPIRGREYESFETPPFYMDME